MKRNFKIKSKSTYHPSLALFLAFLVLNALVLKKMHFHFDGNHHHEHRVQHTDDCQGTVQLNEVELDTHCFICDFNFSPIQSSETASTSELANKYKAKAQSSFAQLISGLSVEYPHVRGPPQLIEPTKILS